MSIGYLALSNCFRIASKVDEVWVGLFYTKVKVLDCHSCKHHFQVTLALAGKLNYNSHELHRRLRGVRVMPSISNRRWILLCLPRRKAKNYNRISSRRQELKKLAFGAVTRGQLFLLGPFTRHNSPSVYIWSPVHYFSFIRLLACSGRSTCCFYSYVSSREGYFC